MKTKLLDLINRYHPMRFLWFALDLTENKKTFHYILRKLEILFSHSRHFIFGLFAQRIFPFSGRRPIVLMFFVIPFWYAVRFIHIVIVFIFIFRINDN